MREAHVVCIFFAGFNVETVEYKNISFTVWDVGGQDKVLLFLLIRFSVGILILYQYSTFDKLNQISRNLEHALIHSQRNVVFWLTFPVLMDFVVSF